MPDHRVALMGGEEDPLHDRLIKGIQGKPRIKGDSHGATGDVIKPAAGAAHEAGFLAWGPDPFKFPEGEAD
jgi:hypothetical protein